ncbi:MAG: cupredoxin domain-containing protein [Gimesia sp.]|nr:cupredoxin domain-containing protein [Gimesia sp.]
MSKFYTPRFCVSILASVAIVLISSQAFAAGTGSHGHGEGMKTGAPADASTASRTVTVTMYDNYYEPENLSFKEGETVRIIVKNEGSLVHEFNIATAAMHKGHAPEMMMMVEHGVLEADKINWEAAKKMQASMGHGMHDEPNSVLLEPGKSGEIVWTFPSHTDLEFACNIPGHYDAGMVGNIKLTQ